MTLRNRGLLLVALATLVIALVALFPARVAYRLADNPLIAMSGIKGTIWNGSAREFSTNGVYLRDLDWDMQPWKLLTGKAVYAVSGSPVTGFFQSNVAISMGGELTLSDLTASLPLAMFEAASNIRGIRGTAGLRFERLTIANGRATAMDGSIDVGNLSVPLVSRSPLGGYRAEFFTQNNGIVASVEDTDGVIDLAGSLQINPDNSYAFLGQIATKSNTPDGLARQMQFLPEADRPGQREIRLEGSL